MEKIVAGIDLAAKYWFCYAIIGFVSRIIGELKVLPERTRFNNRKVIMLLSVRFLSASISATTN